MAQVKNGATAVAEVEAVAEEAATPEDAFASDDLESVDADQIDDLFKDLKTLLGTVEKLQKARQDVGDIKPLILRLLDGELRSGD